MKKILIILVLAPGILIAQNACKTCSEFSKTEEWSKFMQCVTKEIEKDNNINDYMCRAISYGFAFSNLNSIESNDGKKILKKEALNLALQDFNTIIKLDSTFANGIPFKLRSEVKKQLGKDHCNDMKIYCQLTNRCEDYEKDCQK
ncbi:MAG: hypothetical protein VX689_03110 [Bacteroidota bacterium]|nr:hypothetical protein [Bacteroidota bacterium]